MLLVYIQLIHTAINADNTTRMSGKGTRETRIKRLLYQSWYRGCKETDKILGGFAKEHLLDMSDAELDEFEAILEEPDLAFYNWFSGKVALPEKYLDSQVMQRIMAFDVAGQWR